MESLQKLQGNIDSAENLQSIVSTMKAHASSNITQFQNAAKASKSYRDVLDKSLYIIFSQEEQVQPEANLKGKILHIIFGSDHGLAGRFNERISTYALENIPNDEKNISMIIGQQAFQRLQSEISIFDLFSVPQTTESITTMVNKVLFKIDELRSKYTVEKVILHYNRPEDKTGFEETSEILFPIDLMEFSKSEIKWKSNRIPTYFTGRDKLISDLIQQYFFITIYRAFCYSLASENQSRLTSMQSAETNIEERLDELNFKYRRQRQNSITEEINDVISGFKAIKKSKI